MWSSLLSLDGAQFLLRWIHFLTGITWIGLLYYFNFVQGEFFKETDPSTKKAATQKLVPRALWWFRWAAMFTFLSGLSYLSIRGHLAGMEAFHSSWGIFILTGASLGTLMFLNVWLIIWPNQKRIIAAANGENVGDTSKNAAKSGLASRTNTLFSIPMLFFMGAASHLPKNINYNFNCGLLVLILAIIIGGLELNSIKGKPGPMASIKGVITCGIILTAVLYTVIEIVT